MKRITFYLLSFAVLLSACNAEDGKEQIPVSEIRLDKTSIELSVGEDAVLSVEILPEDATIENPVFVWESADESIVSVDQTGKLTALAEGTTEVTVSLESNQAKCQVTVTPVVPESVVLDKSELDLKKGEEYKLHATVKPEEAECDLLWTSSDKTVAEVKTDGTVLAVGEGEAVVTVSAGEAVAECVVRVTEEQQQELMPGSYYYSDGTWSNSIDAEKTLVGIVFWVGDPTVNDAALKRDHPDCKNGLVIALDEPDRCNYLDREEDNAFKNQYPEYKGNVSFWAEANLSGYDNIYSGRDIDDNINKIVGYNNTKVLEAFNAAPENKDWCLNVVELLEDYRQSVPVSDKCSGWYIPSPKELSLYSLGDYDGNIDGLNGASGLVDNLYEMNDILKGIQGASPLNMDAYWTSSETDFVYGDGRLVALAGVPYGSLGSSPTISSHYLRFVLAF